MMANDTNAAQAVESKDDAQDLRTFDTISTTDPGGSVWWSDRLALMQGAHFGALEVSPMAMTGEFGDIEALSELDPIAALALAQTQATVAESLDSDDIEPLLFTSPTVDADVDSANGLSLERSGPVAFNGVTVSAELDSESALPQGVAPQDAVRQNVLPQRAGVEETAVEQSPAETPVAEETAPVETAPAETSSPDPTPQALEPTEPNNAPTVSGISAQTTNEDTSFSYDVAAHFADADADDSLRFALGDGAPNWLSINPQTGLLSGSPENNDVGDASVTVIATDGSGETAQTSFTLSVTNTNDAPTVSSISAQSAAEDTAFSYDASTHFADADAGDSLSFSLGDGAPSWLSIDADTGALSGSPENNDVGDASVTIIATDDAGETAQTSFTLSVTNANDAPTVSSISAQSAAEDTAFSYDASTQFADVDAGDSLSFSLGDGAPSWLSIDADTGVLSGSPANADVGDATVTVVATDNAGETAQTSFTLSVTNANDAPTVSSISAQSAAEDTAFSYDASTHFTDADAGDSLSFSLGDGAPSWLSIDADTGALSGSPANADVGDASVIIIATDGSGETAQTSFTLSVTNTNDAPEVALTGDANVTIEENVTGAPITTFTASDIDGDALTYTVSDNRFEVVDDNGALTLKLKDDASIRYEDESSVDVTVTATDAAGATASQTVTVDITNTNNAPTVSSISAQSAAEDTAFSYDASTHFTDADAGDSLSFSLGDGAPAWLSIDADTGSLSGSPANADVGDASVTVIATDDAGETAQTSFTLSVTNTNDAPTVSSISAQSAPEDAAFSYDASTHFTDADAGDSLSFSLGDGAPAWLSIDADTGALSGTPANNDVGDASVTIIATDNAGEIAQTSFTLSVTNTNDAPTVSSISAQSAAEDTAFSYDASTHFTDADAGDSLSFSLGDGAPSWLSIDADTGALSGTPANNDVGDASVTIIATDNAGEIAQTSFTLSVTNANDAPTVSSISAQSAAEDTAFSYDASTHFTDADAGDSLSFSLGDGAPSWLSIDADTGALSGSPANADVGDASVTVVATDDAGETAQTGFTLSVTNTNDAPTVSSISAQSAPEDAAFSYDASTHFTDADAGDSLSFSLGDGAPSWLSIDADTGALSGSPANADVGGASVTVIATDDAGETAQTGFTLSVTNTNDTPTVSSISFQSAAEDTAFSYDASTHFTDADAGDSLSFSLGDGAPSWLSIDADTGALSGSPANADVGDASVTVIATDNAGETAQTSFTLSVTNANDAPTVSSISAQSAAEDTAFSYDASTHFTDVDAGDSLSFSLGDGAPSWLSIDADTGALSGSPANADVGDASVTVIATDDAGETAQTSFTLSVTNTNDAPTVSSISAQSAPEDAAFSYDASTHFTDADAGDSLSFSLGDGAPAWLSIDADTGALSGSPANADVGDASVTVIATDDAGETAQTSFTLSVTNTNDAPTVSSISAQSAAEDTAFSYDASTHFTDADAGDSLSFSLGDGAPSWLSIDADTGALSGSPANADVGDASVTVVATDGSGETAQTSFTLSVTNANDAPTVSSISAQSAAEDTAFSYDASTHFTDADAGDSLSFSLGDGAPSWLSIDADTGALSGSPANADVGDASITIIATDDAGETAQTSFTLSVTNTNDAPTVSSISAQSAAEDTAFSYDASTHFTDADAGDSLSFSLGDGAPAWLSIDADTGALSGSPANADVGDASVTIIATDGSGETAQTSFTLSVTNTNDAPTVTFSSSNTNIDESTPGTTVTTFTATDADGDALTYTVSDNRFEVVDDNGALTLKLKDSIGIRHEDEPSVDVTVTATDTGGAASSQTVTVNIDNTNNAPTITLVGTTPEDATVENGVAGATVAQLTVADADGHDVTLSVSDSRFEAVASGDGYVLKLKDGVSLDKATESSVDVSITAVDQFGEASSETVSIDVIEYFFLEQNGTLVVEAENFTTNTARKGYAWTDSETEGAMHVDDSPSATKMWTSQNNVQNNAPELTYEVYFETPGTYYVHLRGYTEDGNPDQSDSAHIGLDGTRLTGSGGLTGFGTEMSWGSVDTSSREPVTIEVTEAGQHTFNLWPRENGISIDKIVLTQDPDYQPSGVGPAESPFVSSLDDNITVTSDAPATGTAFDDLFVFGDLTGDASIVGGEGLDTVSISSDVTAEHGDWTIAIENGPTLTKASSIDEFNFDEAVSGVITFADSTEVDFSGIESVTF